MPEITGTVAWTELMTRDIAAAKRFYGRICGWRFVDVPMGPDGPIYTLGMKGEQPVIGMMDMADSGEPPEVAPYWMSYFAVADVDATVEGLEEMGGRLVRPPFDVPGTGRIAIVIDPTGALHGLMTPEPMPEA